MRRICMLLLFCAVLLCAEAPITIAVNDLEGQNVDSSTALILSNRLRNELINTNAYTIVERGEMASILQEQGFQASGACSEASCLVEIGQLLGVQMMVAGTVGKLNDNFYTISLRMIDVGSGKITHAASHDHAGSLERLLSEGIPAAVGKLVRSSGASVKNLSTGLTGDLYIESSIPGASISINGTETGKVTPTMFESYPVGTHIVTVQKEGYDGNGTVTVETKTLAKISISMKEVRSAVMLQSVPSDAIVMVGTTVLGKTPLKVDTLSTGSYEFRFIKQNFKTLVQTLDVENGKSASLNATLEPSATLSISINPVSTKLDTIQSKISINGVLVGSAPWKSDTLSLGEYQIAISKKNFKDSLFSISLAHGDEFTKKITLSLTDEYVQKTRKKKQWTRRVLFGLIGGGLAGAGYAFDKKVEEANTTYLATAGYEQSKHDENYDMIGTNTKVRNIFYGSAGAFGLGFLLSIPF